MCLPWRRRYQVVVSIGTLTIGTFKYPRHVQGLSYHQRHDISWWFKNYPIDSLLIITHVRSCARLGCEIYHKVLWRCACQEDSILHLVQSMGIHISGSKVDNNHMTSSITFHFYAHIVDTYYIYIHIYIFRFRHITFRFRYGML